jgi:hypothetical protein
MKQGFSISIVDQSTSAVLGSRCGFNRANEFPKTAWPLLRPDFACGGEDLIHAGSASGY